VIPIATIVKKKTYLSYEFLISVRLSISLCSPLIPINIISNYYTKYFLTKKQNSFQQQYIINNY